LFGELDEGIEHGLGEVARQGAAHIGDFARVSAAKEIEEAAEFLDGFRGQRIGEGAEVGERSGAKGV
jgi:hypothetical protein